MKPRILAVVALLSLGLAACGNKGPLVLPTAPPAETPPPESPAAAEPTPETLNDATRQPPEQGDATESGDAATPPGATPPPTP